MSAPAPADAGRTHVRLPAILDLSAAAPLASALLDHRGEAIALEADGVERLGALCFQVLVSARITWAADNTPFAIVAPSEPFKEALLLLGGNAFAVEEALPS